MISNGTLWIQAVQHDICPYETETLPTQSIRVSCLPMDLTGMFISCHTLSILSYLCCGVKGSIWMHIDMCDHCFVSPFSSSLMAVRTVSWRVHFQNLGDPAAVSNIPPRVPYKACSLGALQGMFLDLPATLSVLTFPPLAGAALEAHDWCTLESKSIRWIIHFQTHPEVVCNFITCNFSVEGSLDLQ